MGMQTVVEEALSTDSENREETTQVQLSEWRGLPRRYIRLIQDIRDIYEDCGGTLLEEPGMRTRQYFQQVTDDPEIIADYGDPVTLRTPVGDVTVLGHRLEADLYNFWEELRERYRTVETVAVDEVSTRETDRVFRSGLYEHTGPLVRVREREPAQNMDQLLNLLDSNTHQ